LANGNILHYELIRTTRRQDIHPDSPLFSRLELYRDRTLLPRLQGEQGPLYVELLVFVEE
jgi:hypothetical protein